MFEDEVRSTKGLDCEGVGIANLSKYLCELLYLEDGIFERPEKGSTWALLPNVKVCK